MPDSVCAAAHLDLFGFLRGIPDGRMRRGIRIPAWYLLLVAALCTAICDWTIAQIPRGAADLDQLVCDAKTLRGSIKPTVAGA